MPSRADRTWDGTDWGSYVTSLEGKSTVDHDPHAKPLGRAIATGWSDELRTEGYWNAESVHDAWVHTTSDGVIHLGWARTYCGIEIQWENSQMGKPTQATCEECQTDYASSKLDPVSWLARKKARRCG